ncbi:hypothetical protein DVH24_006438 [Malus domestica]|uniref:Uncharacterized protein n=1 Tax=Malus domestica TaxID=3750 RepID=A0A498KCN6_MALDO|nr:hypothetical protein DVH24_006438 [Malus domestica]
MSKCHIPAQAGSLPGSLHHRSTILFALGPDHALTVLFLGTHEQLPSGSPILGVLWPPSRLTSEFLRNSKPVSSLLGDGPNDLFGISRPGLGSDTIFHIPVRDGSLPGPVPPHYNTILSVLGLDHDLTVLFLGTHEQLPSGSPILGVLWPPSCLTSEFLRNSKPMSSQKASC